jgi:hypothetical protein
MTKKRTGSSGASTASRRTTTTRRTRSRGSSSRTRTYERLPIGILVLLQQLTRALNATQVIVRPLQRGMEAILTQQHGDDYPIETRYLLPSRRRSRPVNGTRKRSKR